MGFVDREETRFYRDVIGKIEVGSADAAGQGTTERSLQASGAEGEYRFGIGEEKSRGNFVLSAAKFAVPICGELVVGIFAGFAGDKSTRSARSPRDRGNQKTIWITELVALEIQKREGNGIKTRDASWESIGEKCRLQGSFGAVRGNNREAGVVDLGARGKRAALAGTLVIYKKETKFFFYHRPAQACTENILFHGGARLRVGIQEIFVGIENVVAKELVCIAMKLPRAGF